MSGLSFKSAVLSLAFVCFLSGSALADSFTFTGDANLGDDLISFFLSGPSFSIHSASPAGPAGGFVCLQGILCNVLAQFIQATPSYIFSPGDFSGGTVGSITAYSLGGGLLFSSSSFTAGGPNNFGSGPVTFTGDLTGFVFLPLGCEESRTCTDFGPQVFHLHLSGTGIVTASGEDLGNGNDGIFLLTYNFRGTATTTPEPASLLLVSSGLAGLAVLGRWRLRTKRVGN